MRCCFETKQHNYMKSKTFTVSADNWPMSFQNLMQFGALCYFEKYETENRPPLKNGPLMGQ